MINYVRGKLFLCLAQQILFLWVHRHKQATDWFAHKVAYYVFNYLISDSENL